MLLFGLLLFFLYTPSITLHPGLLIGWVVAVMLIYEATIAEVESANGGDMGWRLLLWGLTLRLPFLILPTDGEALLSGDVYRMLWDGLVVKNGFNPYLISPDSPYLDPLRQLHLSLGSLAEQRSATSFYPPLAELLFSVVGPDRLLFRQILCSIDLLLLFVLLRGLIAHGRSEGALARYALLPLPAIEAVGQGHFSGVVAFAAVAAILYATRGKWFGTGCAIGLAVGLKLIAAIPGIVALFALGREAPEKPGRVLGAIAAAAGVIAIAILPFWMRGGLGIDAFRGSPGRPEFNGMLYMALHELFALFSFEQAELVSRIVLSLLAAGGITAAFLKLNDPFERCAAALGIIIICAPSVYPWYLLWVAPFLVLIDESSWSVGLRYLCTSTMLSYEVLRHRVDWTVPWWIVALELGLPLVGIAVFRWERAHWPFADGASATDDAIRDAAGA